LELPEDVFEHTAAATLGIVANKGRGSTPVVRRIRARDLPAFRITGIPSKSFVSQLPYASADPWVLTPFFSVLERAEARKEATLGAVGQMRLGFQAYGTDATFATSGSFGPVVLDDPSVFMACAHEDHAPLQRLTSPPSMLRRTGPIRLYGCPKLVIRATTNRQQRARLASLPDEQGLWFSDKFIGIWLSDDAPPLLGIAAYLQTAFCELWLSANNPSRKLRVGGLARLPIPPLPRDWWDRAASLVRPNRTVTSPRWATSAPSLLDTGASLDEWDWFERVVAVAFGITTSELAAVEQHLVDQLTVGRG